MPTLGRYALLPPGPRLTPFPPADDVAWLRGVGMGVVPCPECNSHLGPKSAAGLCPQPTVLGRRGLSSARLWLYDTSLAKGALASSTQTPLPLGRAPTPQERVF